MLLARVDCAIPAHSGLGIAFARPECRRGTVITSLCWGIFSVGAAHRQQLGKLGRQVWGALGSRGEKMGSANKAVMGDAVMELRSFQIFRTKLRRLAIHDPAPMDLLPLDHHHHHHQMAM